MSETDNLYAKLCERVGVSGSEILPEILQMIISEDEAQMLLALPGTSADLSERFEIDSAEMETKLEEFFFNEDI